MNLLKKIITPLIGILSLTLIWTLIAPNIERIPSAKEITLVQISILQTALDDFKLENKRYPSTKEGLEALLRNPNKEKYPNFNNPYLAKLPKDGWGSTIQYIQKENGFELISYGADRKKGGLDDDIKSIIKFKKN